jgi:high-affinity nickel permease
MFYRIVLITGITIISAVFVGAILLVGVLEAEKPLSGNVRDTIGADKKAD